MLTEIGGPYCRLGPRRHRNTCAHGPVRASSGYSVHPKEGSRSSWIFESGHRERSQIGSRSYLPGTYPVGGKHVLPRTQKISANYTLKVILNVY